MWKGLEDFFAENDQKERKVSLIWHNKYRKLLKYKVKAKFIVVFILFLLLIWHFTMVLHPSIKYACTQNSKHIYSHESKANYSFYSFVAFWSVKTSSTSFSECIIFIYNLLKIGKIVIQTVWVKPFSGKNGNFYLIFFQMVVGFYKEAFYNLPVLREPRSGDRRQETRETCRYKTNLLQSIQHS